MISGWTCHRGDPGGAGSRRVANQRLRPPGRLGDLRPGERWPRSLGERLPASCGFGKTGAPSRLAPFFMRASGGSEGAGETQGPVNGAASASCPPGPPGTELGAAGRSCTVAPAGTSTAHQMKPEASGCLSGTLSGLCASARQALASAGSTGQEDAVLAVLELTAWGDGTEQGTVRGPGANPGGHSCPHVTSWGWGQLRGTPEL